MIKKILEKSSIYLSEEKLEKFEIFLKIFVEKNSQINLSAIRDEKSIITKHFLDSLMITRYTTIKWKIWDLGTGGWFPGIPLKIFYGDDISIDLIDSVAKKLTVIEDFLKELDIKNYNTIHSRAEDLWQDKKYRWKYDIILSRATAYLPTLIEYSVPLLKVWWELIAYKTDNKKEVEESKKVLSELDCEIIRIEKYEIEEQGRILIWIKKVWETPRKYPRKAWMPAKDPII